MKRGLAGRTRRGAPPLPQQRRALRVVQIVLFGLSVLLGWLTVQSWSSFTESPATGVAALGQTVETGIGQVIVLFILTLAAFAGALAMGLRIVRGPTPPEL
jgi:TRAP-type C4-dicarboxylate transport system permease small subunit